MGRSSKSKPEGKMVRGVNRNGAYTDIYNEYGRTRIYSDCEMVAVPGFNYKVVTPVRRSSPDYPNPGDDDSNTRRLSGYVLIVIFAVCVYALFYVWINFKTYYI